MSTSKPLYLTSGFPLLVSLVLLILFTGCSRKNIDVAVPVESPESFSYSGEVAMDDRWWTSFGDSSLNTLMDTALNSNLNLRTAWYRISEARSVLDRESAAFFPDIFASLQGETGSGQTAFEVNDNIRLGITADYELDLWGRIRYAVEAVEYRLEATRADYQAAAISLTAEIALTWYRLIEAQQQLEIAMEQTETNEKVLSLLRSRFRSGQTRGVDIFRQQQLLEATHEQQILQETNLMILEHQLAVLLGNPPGNIHAVLNDSLPDLPPLPETGIPLELVRRRPDVQSAWYRLNAADRELASAMSSRYPRIALTAQFTSRGGDPDQLFRDWAYSISGNLLAPLFYGGELQAEADRNEAVKNQRLYAYGQEVLMSFREVEDALAREMKQKEVISSLQQQYDMASKSYAQLRMEYFNGLGNYLDVLTALEDLQQLQRDLLDAKGELLEFRISLYRALSGGFETGNEEYDPGLSTRTTLDENEAQ